MRETVRLPYDVLEAFERAPGRTVTIPPGPPAIGGRITPWNSACLLRYVHNHARRVYFRYRHGPALDAPNSFETVEFS